VATVGRRADDGPFDAFVAALAEPEFDGGEPFVRWTGRDGRELELGWTGPFLVDGVVAGLGADGRPEHPPLLDNPAVRVSHGGQRLEAAWGGHRLVLDLMACRRLEPPSGTS
jgi:hypothetical protein